MANPTTYFGWVMPTATDLVTDLPADFNVFGQGVDTSMQDLLGGTTGQVLSKTSGTDMDFTWINNDQGDITAVTAGTGISGGGTSGAVTVTNSMATAITTAGDVIQGTGSGTFARLGIGTAGQVLTVNGGATALQYSTPVTASGLTFIKAQTIGTTVSSVTVTGAFSATYDNYLIQVSGGVSSSAGITGQLTLGSTTTGYYMAGQYQYYSNTTVTGFNINNGTNFSATYSTDKTHSGKIDLQNPFASEETVFSSVLISAATGEYQARYAGFLNNTTSYTAFTLTPNTGTFTGGTIRVYGYQNS